MGLVSLNGSKIDFLGTPYFWTIYMIFVIILKFIFTSIFEIKIDKNPLTPENPDSLGVDLMKKKSNFGLLSSEKWMKILTSDTYIELIVCNSVSAKFGAISFFWFDRSFEHPTRITTPLTAPKVHSPHRVQREQTFGVIIS